MAHTRRESRARAHPLSNDSVKKLLLGTFLFFLLGLAAGMVVLPDNYRIERRIEIAAEPEVVYEVISNLHTWPEWTAWNLGLDPQAVFDFSGEPSGDGARLVWDGPKLKRGEVNLFDCEEPQHIAYTLDFESGKHIAEGTFEISTSMNGSFIVWTNSGELPGWTKLMGPMLSSLVAPQLESGLEGLKRRIEAPNEAVL